MQKNKNLEPKFHTLAYRAKALTDLTTYGRELMQEPDIKEIMVISKLTIRAKKTMPYSDDAVESLVKRVMLLLGFSGYE